MTPEKPEDLDIPEPTPVPPTNSMVKVVTKAASMPKVQSFTLRPQISAPSYLSSLKDNPLPPFKRPGPPVRPCVLLGTIVTEETVVDMVLASEHDPPNGMRKYLDKLLIEKNITEKYEIPERRFLVSFLLETVKYAAEHDFSGEKLSCLLTIYLRVHQYFKWYYWTPPTAVWGFFKEVMTRHTIEDAPDGTEVFEPEESYDIMTHFHTNYLSHLPLIHIATFGVYKLKLEWPTTINTPPSSPMKRKK